MDSSASVSRFQSTPPARGATRTYMRKSWPNSTFQSTPPARGATARAEDCRENEDDFNPRPPRGGRRRLKMALEKVVYISIHAPREGGDSGRDGALRACAYFNPRPPRGGRQHGRPILHILAGDFNPRPPRGGDAQISRNTPSILRISIHAPREGGDLGLISAGNTRNVFQSTPPARGATL